MTSTEHTQHKTAFAATVFPVTVRVFADEGTTGNRARVYWEDPMSASEMQRWATERWATEQWAADYPAVSCFIESPKTPGGPYPVRCFNRDTEIRMCGHGLLAAGCLIARHQGCRQLSLRTLDGHEIPINVTETGAQGRWPLLTPRPVELPAWVASAFSTPPRSAATAGGPGGYLILQWDEKTQLADVTVDMKCLERETQQAIIATQRDAHRDYDFLLRYFAPQYGTPEDTVTGSAVRILAGYWQPTLTQHDFRARQCSPGGGIVSGRIKGDAVFIGGSVTLLTTVHSTLGGQLLRDT